MKYWRVIRDKSRSRQTYLDKPLTAFPVGLRSVDSNLAAETVVSSTGRTAWISFSKWNLINISKNILSFIPLGMKCGGISPNIAVIHLRRWQNCPTTSQARYLVSSLGRNLERGCQLVTEYYWTVKLFLLFSQIRSLFHSNLLPVIWEDRSKSPETFTFKLKTYM